MWESILWLLLAGIVGTSVFVATRVARAFPAPSSRVWVHLALATATVGLCAALVLSAWAAAGVAACVLAGINQVVLSRSLRPG